MGNVNSENTVKRRFFSLKSVSSAVLCVLLGLIFLSKSIYNHNLPVVTAASPQKGRLNKIELTTGTAVPSDITELTASVQGTVKTVFVKEGDTLYKGQPIAEMSFDDGQTDEIIRQIEALRKDTDTRLKELEISRGKLNVDIEKINANILHTKRKIEELLGEDYSGGGVSEYELLSCEREIRLAESELEKKRALLEAGALSQSELLSAENALQNLTDKYESLKLAAAENALDMEENRRRQLADYEYQLAAYEQDIMNKTLDLEANALLAGVYENERDTKLEDYNRALSDYERGSVITAPEASVVLSVDVNRGRRVNAGERIASVGDAGSIVVECTVSYDNSFITAGDTCKLDNSRLSREGTVISVTPFERSKRVVIAVSEGFAAKGEVFDITFEKTSGESYTLVPNGAVNMDSDGYFLYQIKRRDGILGKEFYTEKLRVYIGDSDYDNTVIVKGVSFFEPVALISDKPFSEGETVKLENESDFFVD